MLRKSLQCVWNKAEEFCCLCLTDESAESIHIDDEVMISLNDTEHYILLSEILVAVFNYEILDYVQSFSQICKKCTQSAINSYIFIEKCKLNTKLLSESIESLLRSVDNCTDNMTSNYGSLYININTKDFSTLQFYDKKKLSVNPPFMNLKSKPTLNAASLKDKETSELCKRTLGKESAKNRTKLNDNQMKTIKTKDMMSEQSNQKKIIECKECFKHFTTLLNLRNHYIRIHAPKRYKCKQCNKKFGSRALLQLHKTENHNINMCSECGKTFHNKQTYNAHVSTHYVKYVCEDCGKVYKNKSTFNMHFKLNICGQKSRGTPANAKYTCDYCKKKYTQKVSLRVHIQYEHGNYKYHVCEICNKKFWALSRLKAHMVKHTKERNFKCSLCDGKFVTKEALVCHTRIHTGEKPYECPQCDARFISTSRRAAHLKRHHANSSYECDVCKSKFSSHNYLQKHKNGHLNSKTSVSQKPDLNRTRLGTDTSFIKSLTQLNGKEYKYDPKETAVFLEFKNDIDYNIQIAGL